MQNNYLHMIWILDIDVKIKAVVAITTVTLAAGSLVMLLSTSINVKARCLYGGTIRTPPSRYRGVQVFTYKELEMATDNFSEVNVIRNGGFGEVYKGVLGDGTMAAIKRLHADGKQGERDFRMEVDLLSRLNCPYLVKLLGYCADQNHWLLIYEFKPNGSLQQHLHPFDTRVGNNRISNSRVAAIAAMCVQPAADYRPIMVDVVQSLIPLVKSSNPLISSGSSRFQ